MKMDLQICSIRQQKSFLIKIIAKNDKLALYSPGSSWSRQLLLPVTMQMLAPRQSLTRKDIKLKEYVAISNILPSTLPLACLEKHEYLNAWAGTKTF